MKVGSRARSRAGHQGAVREMASDVLRSGGTGRLALAADAFLFAAALNISTSAVFMAVNAATGFANTDMTESPPLATAMQAGFMLATVGVVAYGAVMAWRSHGRSLTPATGAWMLLGAVLGTPAALGVFGLAAYSVSKIPVGSPESPPWLAIGLLAAVVVAFLAAPVVAAIRDLSGPKERVRLDWMRLGALGIVIAMAVVALPIIGTLGDSEVAEAGIFMVPFASAAIFAVLGADFATRMRERRDGGEAAVHA